MATKVMSICRCHVGHRHPRTLAGLSLAMLVHYNRVKGDWQGIR